MAITFIDPTPFADFLRSDAHVIITANNRIRAHLLRALALATPETRALRAPQVFTLAQYINQCWHTQLPAAKPHIISGEQRRYLWQRIITHSELGQGLLQAKPLAQQADAALRHLALWKMSAQDLRDGEFSLPDNSLQLLEWIDAFEAELTARDSITQEDAITRLVAAFSAGDLAATPKPRACLVGFDEIAPLHQAFLDAAFSEHWQQTPSADTATPRQVMRLSFDTQEQELEAAARWAALCLRQSPEARFALIVPNLGQCRDQVERVFTRVLLPQTLHPSQPQTPPPFNFSAGVPLATTPVIASALSLVQLFERDWPLDALCNLLHSPFWHHADAVVAPVTRALRQLQRLEVGASDLLICLESIINKLSAEPQNAETRALTEAKALLAQLQDAQSFSRQLRGAQPLGVWVDALPQLLARLNWPGPRALDSLEHQQVAHFYQLLETSLELSWVAGALPLRDYLSEIAQMAHSTPFQAQTPLSPIQILGALESAALEFDYAWVMGLHNRQWPPAPAPNPFLPVALQREANMPHASAERELRFAESLTAHFLRCAHSVILSSPLRLEDQTLAPSPLISHILQGVDPTYSATPSRIGADASRTGGDPDQALSLDDYARQLMHRLPLESLIDTRAPAVSPSERVRGGASILKAQAACPFTAFARYRLGAINPPAAQAGISPADRGNLLHNALASIWRELGDQSALLALAPEALQTLISQTVSAELSQLSHLRGLERFPLLLDAEATRSETLIGELLARDAARPPFSVISIEAPLKVDFGGLGLQLRLDRIDQLTGGGHLLIDYKTGQPSSKDWLQPRPKDPQLPLYALVSDPPASALAFARVSTKGTDYIGMGTGAGLPVTLDVCDDWPAQLALWREQLLALVDEFLQGEASVTFTSEEARRHAADLRALHRDLS